MIVHLIAELPHLIAEAVELTAQAQAPQLRAQPLEAAVLAVQNRDQDRAVVPHVSQLPLYFAQDAQREISVAHGSLFSRVPASRKLIAPSQKSTIVSRFKSIQRQTSARSANGNSGWC